MPRIARPEQASRWTDRLAFFFLALLLFTAPWVRGGNRQVAVAALLGIALLLAALLGTRAVVTPIRPISWGPAALVALVASSPVWVGLLHLSSLGGVLGHLPLDGSHAGLPSISQVPTATWASVLAGVPVATGFLAAMLLPARHVERLLWVLLLAAALQLAVALGQLVQGPTSGLYFDSKISGLIGTFNNRNHLADLFAMVVPVWLYLLTQPNPTAGEHEGPLARATKPFMVLFGFAMVVVVLATQSRGGLAVTAFALVASVALFAGQSERRLSIGQKLGLAAGLALFGLAAAVSVGLAKSSERFEQETLRSDAELRHAYTQASMEGARAAWPWGTGSGSYEATFPRFQPRDTTGYIDFAHNDYAQLLFELGAPGAALIGLVGWLVLIQAWRLWRQRQLWGRRQAMRANAGLGAAAMLLHSTVEFNMHIPALAVVAAFLLGTYLRPLDTD